MTGIREEIGDVTAASAIVSGMVGRYAGALFSLAVDARAEDAVAADLARIKAMIADSDDLARLVRSAAHSSEMQGQGLSAVLARAGISELTANFCRLVAKNRRLHALEAMIDGYNALLADARGQSTAHVTVAEPLSATQTKALTDALKESTGKDVALDVTLDPAIIGGIIVRHGSRMVDASLKTKLNAIHHAMKEVR